MQRSRWSLPTLLIAAWFAVPAQAHFIFAVPEPAEQPKVVKIYFSELASPDDPALLTRIDKAKVWVTGGRGEPKPLELTLSDDALVGEIPAGRASGTIFLNHTYGVMTRGEAPYLLKYYAKAYPGSLPGNWNRVDREELPLEIVPELAGNEVLFKVYWKGERAPGVQVTVENPDLGKLQGDTNDKGEYLANLAEPGLYSVRARLIEETPGEERGQKYESIKHYSTLTLNYAPAKVEVAADRWPQLEKGTTSFGAAVVGDQLYIYGGNYGGGHEYSEEMQSGDFITLNLKDGKTWQALPGGPKLTGLAMTAHGGKVYRVGGFTVKDNEGGKAQLNSQDSFARFDPAKGTWEELAPLPEGRSSHDIAVVGVTLYVVGGWCMKAADGNNDHGWLKTVYACDLTSETPEWKKVPEAPFERRALSTAAHNGKLYVIGGMQSSDGVTPRVAVFDPATQTWSEGPAILGSGMEGFGTAAFAVNGRLFVTTMSGSVQALSDDGSRWEYVGQLHQPRFFHEMTPWQNGLVIVGGASMETGKAESLEFISLTKPENADKKAAMSR